MKEKKQLSDTPCFWQISLPEPLILNPNIPDSSATDSASVPPVSPCSEYTQSNDRILKNVRHHHSDT
jgi:hypothetical protein